MFWMLFTRAPWWMWIIIIGCILSSSLSSSMLMGNIKCGIPLISDSEECDEDEDEDEDEDGEGLFSDLFSIVN